MVAVALTHRLSFLDNETPLELPFQLFNSDSEDFFLGCLILLYPSGKELVLIIFTQERRIFFTIINEPYLYRCIEGCKHCFKLDFICILQKVAQKFLKKSFISSQRIKTRYIHPADMSKTGATWWSHSSSSVYLQPTVHKSQVFLCVLCVGSCVYSWLLSKTWKQFVMKSYFLFQFWEQTWKFKVFDIL